MHPPPSLPLSLFLPLPVCLSLALPLSFSLRGGKGLYVSCLCLPLWGSWGVWRISDVPSTGIPWHVFKRFLMSAALLQSDACRVGPLLLLIRPHGSPAPQPSTLLCPGSSAKFKGLWKKSNSWYFFPVYGSYICVVEFFSFNIFFFLATLQSLRAVNPFISQSKLLDLTCCWWAPSSILVYKGRRNLSALMAAKYIVMKKDFPCLLELILWIFHPVSDSKTLCQACGPLSCGPLYCIVQGRCMHDAAGCTFSRVRYEAKWSCRWPTCKLWRD